MGWRILMNRMKVNDQNVLRSVHRIASHDEGIVKVVNKFQVNDQGVIRSFAGDTIPLIDLPLGTLVQDVGTQIYDEPIVWRVIAHNHSGYPADSITLLSEYGVRKGFTDGSEPENPNAGIADKGNSRYIHSNLLQWLNSSGLANTWYEPQHPYDAPPSNQNTNVVDVGAGYDDSPGFLAHCSLDFANSLLTTTLDVVGVKTSDGVYTMDTFNSKVFDLSVTEVVGTQFYSLPAEGVAIEYLLDHPEVMNLVCHERFIDRFLTSTDNVQWLLRSPEPSVHPYFTFYVSTSGIVAEYSRNVTENCVRMMIRPACNIGNHCRVLKEPNEKGVYTISY